MWIATADDQVAIHLAGHLRRIAQKEWDQPIVNTSQMNDKPPSTSGAGSTSLIARLKRAIKGEPWSREEIQDIIQQSETDIDAEEKSMLAGVLEVSETQVRDVMIPRSQMVVIDIEDDIDAMIRVIVESGHSRFPVMGEDRDEVLGVLLAKDLLRLSSAAGKEHFNVREILRPLLREGGAWRTFLPDLLWAAAELYRTTGETAFQDRYRDLLEEVSLDLGAAPFSTFGQWALFNAEHPSRDVILLERARRRFSSIVVAHLDHGLRRGPRRARRTARHARRPPGARAGRRRRRDPDRRQRQHRRLSGDRPRTRGPCHRGGSAGLWSGAAWRHRGSPRPLCDHG